MNELIALAVILSIFWALLKDIVSPAIAFLSGLVIFIIADIVPIENAFEGFANETLITIGSLFVVAKGIENSLNLERFVQKALGSAKNIRQSLLRMVIPVGLSSAFVNNTPIVAMMINPIISWAKKYNVSASKFLIPLSYAAVLGGTLTLIGTSTNLVVSGVMGDYGLGTIGFFELTTIALPIFIVATAAIVLLAPKLVPERKLADVSAEGITREFVMDMRPKQSIVGKTVEQAKLRHLKKIFLVEIVRSNGDKISPVSPQSVIKEGDTLRFSGDSLALLEISTKKFMPLESRHVKKLAKSSTYVEVVIGHDKSLVGKTLKQIGFRAKYQAAALAIFSAGEKVAGSLGNIILKPGDVLLLVVDSGFEERWKDRSDFLFIREVGKTEKRNRGDNRPLYLSIASILTLIAFGFPISISALTGALVMTGLKLVSVRQARNAIDFELLIMIAAAIGVAKGVDSSGLAEVISTNIMGSLGGFGAVGLLIGTIVATTILTEMLSNAASALLIFPIAIASAVEAGLDPRVFALAIAMSASLAFVSPIGYQTHMMVYSAGGYKFSDFFRLGIVINIICMTGTAILLAGRL